MTHFGIRPDGALSRLPFGALPGKTPGTYLIEEHTFAVVPVPQLIAQRVQEKAPNESRKKLLILGNVDYDAPPATALASSDRGRIGLQPVSTAFRSLPPGALHFAPLPGTESEIAAIEKLYRDALGAQEVTALKKSQATKDSFLAKARQHGYLHLATHGFFIEERVGTAALGSREARGNVRLESPTYNGPEAGGTYPALLSGLALAGANRSRKADTDETTDGNEGILTAEEIGAQNLDGVQLVVLSACESGLGKETSGEGLLGLQRSFQSAGARNVVASLWAVDDQATYALMAVFYMKLWKENLPSIKALHEAQLTIYRHPELIEKLAASRGVGVNSPVELPDGGAVQPRGKTASPQQWAAFVLAGVGD